MFSSLTVLLATAAAARAASSASSASPASPTSNPYIPSDISSSCQTYLQTLNEDTDLAPCTSALIAASSAFGPGGNSSSGASKATVTSALGDICSSSTTGSCPQSLLTGKLASFYTECGPELTSSPNAEVKTIYDTFYVLQPFLASVCSKDDSGDYCVTSINATSTTANLETDLVTPSSGSSPARRDGSVAAYMPNAATIDSNNILFLLLNASLPKAELCTTCTRNILTSYTTFESSTNYAPGLAQSVLMSGQSALYQGVVSTCGPDFLTAPVQAAGGLGQTKGTSAALAPRAGGVLATLTGAAVLAAML